MQPRMLYSNDTSNMHNIWPSHIKCNAGCIICTSWGAKIDEAGGEFFTSSPKQPSPSNSPRLIYTTAAAMQTHAIRSISVMVFAAVLLSSAGQIHWVHAAQRGSPGSRLVIEPPVDPNIHLPPLPDSDLDELNGDIIDTTLTDPSSEVPVQKRQKKTRSSASSSKTRTSRPLVQSPDLSGGGIVSSQKMKTILEDGFLPSLAQEKPIKTSKSTRSPGSSRTRTTAGGKLERGTSSSTREGLLQRNVERKTRVVVQDTEVSPPEKSVSSKSRRTGDVVSRGDKSSTIDMTGVSQVSRGRDASASTSKSRITQLDDPIAIPTKVRVQPIKVGRAASTNKLSSAIQSDSGDSSLAKKKTRKNPIAVTSKQNIVDKQHSKSFVYVSVVSF